MKSRRGFSLVELLVVVALFSIMAAALGLSLVSAQKTWSLGTRQAVLTAELRKVLDQVSRELVQSRAAQIQRPFPNGAWDTQVLFRIPQDQNGDGSVLGAGGLITEWSRDISYQMGRSNDCSRAAVNPPGFNPRTTVTTVANHITDLRFRRQAAIPDVVEIRATAGTLTEDGRVMSRTMSTMVKLRN